MVIRYPNGKVYNASPTHVSESASGSPKQKRETSYSNRGKILEDALNESNLFYLQQNLANIHKKPVPIQIVKVDYPARSAAVIREAYFRTPSTTDYNGVWNGYYIDFEAKETENKTSFPLQNIHAHQIEHMKSVECQNGIAFFIIRFSKLGRNFVLPFHIIEHFWTMMHNGSRKSIPITVFEQQAIEIMEGYMPRLDYLQAVKKFIADKTVCESEEK